MKTRADIAVAVAAFVALVTAVLLKSTSLLEPDDLAYRAAIVALSRGHLTLSASAYRALASELGGIQQWVQLPNGRWISEKNPGYPFFAAPFQLAGALRAAPLFYGALGCVGLWFGGRRWLGRFGGTAAVVLFCGSGAALAFAWRATMPTFTDASLIAAGVGALLWTMLADDATRRRRIVVGLLGFAALESATFIRYTNVVVLAVAVVSVLLGFRAARLPFRAVVVWLGSVGALAALVATFDALVYGGVTKTGYASGEITFSWHAVLPNLQHMPRHLVSSMPVLVLALAAVAWLGARAARGRLARRDAAVAASLLACWLAVYGLYEAYTWTERMSSGGDSTIHVVRFYVPALAALALLGAWLVHHLPRWTPALAVAVVVAFGGLSYSHLTSARGIGGQGPAPGGQGFQGGPPPGGGLPPGP